MANRVSRERLYLTRDGDRVVREGDPEAATLLVAAGLEVSDADVEKYGIRKYMTSAAEPYDAIADHAVRHAPEDTKALAAKTNKAKAPSTNKGATDTSNPDTAPPATDTAPPEE